MIRTLTIDGKQVREDQRFLDAIIADPANDQPRLQYADWLSGASDDHEPDAGDLARAEFIRVQCELARLNVDDHAITFWDGQLGQGPEYYRKAKALRARERELLQSSVNCVNWVPLVMHQGSGVGIRCVNPPRVEIIGGGFSEVVFSRGFIANVTCRLEDWIGRPCGICSERGQVRHGTRVRLSPCPSCDATGHIGAHGPAIWAVEPVEVVRTCRHPAHETSPGWYWRRGGSGGPMPMRHDLPDVIFQALDKYTPGNWFVVYPTEADALAALSRALVAWARGSRFFREV